MSIFKNIFQSKSPGQAAVDPLYEAIVTQARQPEFFRAYSVADTLDGRFDMLALHIYLVVHRLRRDGEDAGELPLLLTERMFRELDRALRENGISDMGVPRRVKKMANVFYGRAAAYDTARSSRDELVQALARNVFPGDGPPERAGRLADYALAAMARLDGNSLDEIMQGQPAFPNPEDIS